MSAYGQFCPVAKDMELRRRAGLSGHRVDDGAAEDNGRAVARRGHGCARSAAQFSSGAMRLAISGGVRPSVSIR